MTLTQKAQELQRLNLIGSRCIYSEKGLVELVVIESLTLKDSTYQLEMVKESNFKRTLSVGGLIEDATISELGIRHNGYISFLVISNAQTVMQIESLLQDPNIAHISIVKTICQIASGSTIFSYFPSIYTNRNKRQTE